MGLSNPQHILSNVLRPEMCNCLQVPFFCDLAGDLASGPDACQVLVGFNNLSFASACPKTAFNLRFEPGYLGCRTPDTYKYCTVR